jgi:hypothetical protein
MKAKNSCAVDAGTIRQARALGETLLWRGNRTLEVRDDGSRSTRRMPQVVSGLEGNVGGARCE